MGLLGTCPSKEVFFVRSVVPTFVFGIPCVITTVILLFYVKLKFKNNNEIPFIYIFLTYIYQILVLFFALIFVFLPNLEYYFHLSRYNLYCILSGNISVLLFTIIHCILLYIWFERSKRR